MRISNYGNIKPGYLKLSDFKSFVNANSFINQIELSNSGEVFLNPDLKQILEYAFEKNIVITINSGVNFNNVDDEVLETLVKTQVKSMVIAIDGTTQDIYEKYRRNGNYDIVIENIRKLNALKKMYNCDYPKLYWQFIIMSHNEHQVLDAKKLADDLNMDIRYKLTWDEGYISQNPDFVKKVTGLKYLSREDFQKEGNIYANFCNQMFYEPQINWDGRLLGCCTTMKDFGINVFELGLSQALASLKFVNSKRMILGEKVPEDVTTPCYDCKNFLAMKKSNHFFSL